MHTNCKMYFFVCSLLLFCCSVATNNGEYRVPKSCTDKAESYVFGDREYVMSNFPVTWDKANILCQGHHNGTLALIDTKEKAEFLAEALSESELSIESVWVGARRSSADDPFGYRWRHRKELRRTAVHVYRDGLEDYQFPTWLNRTRVPVPEGGADCVAIERIHHDKPVFVDLHCLLERPFVCEREAKLEMKVAELRATRCKNGHYHIYDGRLNWHQAAAYCILQNMSLANIATSRCLKKLGMAMLQTRPSIENAWIGASGSLGHWSWLDTGISIFQLPSNTDVEASQWPPMRNRREVKLSGCLQLDRHDTHPPVFMEARCERKMQFICYQGNPALTAPSLPSDDTYYYVLVRQKLYWPQAYDNCLKMNGSLASPESSEGLIMLLLVMGENKEEAVRHVWISGRLNMTKEGDVVEYSWYNPSNGKKIYYDDPVNLNNPSLTVYIPPWIDDELTIESPCLNLDRQDHLTGMVYGLPCDTPQYSICAIEKSIKRAETDNKTDGYESTI